MNYSCIYPYNNSFFAFILTIIPFLMLKSLHKPPFINIFQMKLLKHFYKITSTNLQETTKTPLTRLHTRKQAYHWHYNFLSKLIIFIVAVNAVYINHIICCCEYHIICCCGYHIISCCGYHIICCCEYMMLWISYYVLLCIILYFDVDVILYFDVYIILYYCGYNVIYCCI